MSRTKTTSGHSLLLLCIGIMCGFVALALAGCSAEPKTSTSSETTSTVSGYESLRIDMESWSYDSDHDVYYQIGLPYCTDPQATEYESYGIYIPGAYVDSTKNDNGYSLSINDSATIDGLTASTAPIVMPVNTPGYSAQAAPAKYSYQTISEYMDAGFIYVYAGCRGRDNGTNPDGSSFEGGAPWGVTDLKAAIMTLRLNQDLIPGDTDKIFTFGMSGGGAQNSLVGVTGDSELYNPYLESIGAPMTDGDGKVISNAT